MNNYAKLFDPAAFAETAQLLRQALLEQLKQQEAPQSQTLAGSTSKGQINPDQDDLENYVPRFKKGAQAKARKESDGSLLQLLDPQNLGEADRQLIEQASPPEIDVHSLEEQEIQSRLTVLYTFKPSFNPVFKKAFPLYRKTDLPLTRKPRNINESEIVKAIANFDPQASSISEDPSSILTPVESGRTSQVTTPSAQSAIPFSAFNKDPSNGNANPPPAPPPLEPSPSFGTLDPNITSPSNNIQELESQHESPKGTPAFLKKATGEFGDLSFQDPSSSMTKTKSDGDLLQKQPRVMEGSASLGRMVRGSGGLEVLEEAPGEEDSQTRSSPSRKDDKRDTIISSKKQDSSSRNEQDASKVKSVPHGKEASQEEQTKAEENARTAPVKKPKEIKVDQEEYSSNRRQTKDSEKLPDNKPSHLVLDSPHSQLLLKSINTEDLAKLDQVDSETKRLSATIETPHVKSYGNLETGQTQNKEEEKKKQPLKTKYADDEEDDDGDEESEDSFEENEELPRMRPEQAITMSISQTDHQDVEQENTKEEQQSQEKKEEKEEEAPEQVETDPLKKQLDDVLAGALSEFPDF